MSVHITKTYNIGGLIGLRQNAVKNAGETLGFKEMSLFKFPDAYDSDDELHVRMDGIIASLCPEDIVIFQHPSGESPRYDGFLFEHLRRYHGTKIVAFIQEIASDRDDSEYSLSDEITLLNRADMFIFASAALRDYYIANGLKEKPYLIQNIPDYMTDICTNEHKNKKLYIMAETSQNEYPLNNLNIEVVQYDEYRAMESILRLSDGGFGLMLVTTNEYLASRDGAEMGEVYNFMGLSCSYPDADDTKKQDDDEKRQFYSADIIYTTNGTLGFDFLFDNLVKKKEDRFLCDFHYVIIDEADSVLLDSAIMPLVISGVPRVQSNLYDVCDFFVTTLVEDIDYIEEDKAVWLTPKGVKFAESFFGISNFYGKENFEINRHVTLSLRAHKLLKNKKDYVVTDKKEVELFDGATGRLMHGVKLRGGQHQAIEAKEKVEISQEYRTVASVTFQNLFMMFDKMTGMSGTLMDAKDELFETYGKQVVKIPTNRPLKRVDRKDRYFKNGHDQFWTAVDDVIRLHETGQPVLVVLNSVTDTDLFSRLLIEKNIPHNVLNASNAFWEAQIIAGAGQLNAVTVATTMAGRGTDIKLGDGVKELGGLAVIGIGRMNNSRSERQARGRAGRQGDPGFSQYYVSLEDDIVGAEDDDKLQRYIDGKKRIGKRKIKRIVNQCQKLSVESEEMNRKKSLQYDQVLQRQRDLIYATRKKLLDGASVEQEKIVEIAKGNISDFVNHFDCIQSNNKHGRRRGRKKDNDKNTNTQQYTSMLNRYILDNISYKLDAGLTLSDMQSAATVSDYLMLRVYQGLSRQRERIGDEEAYEQFVREATLKAVDDGWVELIDYLEQLKYAVAGRASAQRNVMFEYQNEAFESFLDTEKAVKCNIIRNILLSDVKIGKDGRLQVIYP